MIFQTGRKGKLMALYFTCVGKQTVRFWMPPPRPWAKQTLSKAIRASSGHSFFQTKSVPRQPRDFCAAFPKTGARDVQGQEEEEDIHNYNLLSF